MSTTTPIVRPTPETQEILTRSRRVEIDAPKGGDITLRAVRECFYLEDGEIVSQQPGHDLYRALSQVGSDSVMVGDKEISAAEVATALAALIDQWDVEVVPGPTE